MLFLLIVGLVIGWDLLLKELTDKVLKDKEKQDLAGGRITLKKVHNKGICGGHLAKYSDKLRLLLPVVLLLALIRWLKVLLSKNSNAAEKTGMSLLVGGGAANVIDRWRHGYVRDYLQINAGPRRLRRLAGNLADLCVCFGMILAFLFRSDR